MCLSHSDASTLLALILFFFCLCPCSLFSLFQAADFIDVDVSGVEWQPVYNVVAQLVYVADRTSVSDVWVAGRQLMKQRKLTTLDEKDVLW